MRLLPWFTFNSSCVMLRLCGQLEIFGTRKEKRTMEIMKYQKSKMTKLRQLAESYEDHEGVVSRLCLHVFA